MKNVLVIYYSQSGQLETIAKTIAKPLMDLEEVNVVFHEIQMEKPFPFPWNKESFFDAFPESFLQIPLSLKPVSEEIMKTKFDLILLNFQVWYLSPSIPINSFLKSPEAKKLMNNIPVITINGSRNMWIMAQEKVKVFLFNSSKHPLYNGNYTNQITIVEWMFTGIKKKYLGVFPLPGVSDKDINASSKFGEVIKKCFLTDTLDELQPKLVAIDAVRVSSYLVTVDKTANKIFKKWSNFINNKKSSRKTWLKIFNLYLLIAIWVISPIVYILHIFSYPFKINKIKKEILYYQGV